MSAMNNRECHFVAPGSDRQVWALLEYLECESEYYRPIIKKARASRFPSLPEVLSEIPKSGPSTYSLLGQEALNRASSKHFLTDLTTGTTSNGRKTRYTTRIDDDAEAALCRRFFKGVGVTSGDRIVALDIDSADIYLFYGDVLESIGVNEFTFLSVPSDFDKSIEEIFEIDPTILLSVPSLLGRLLGLLRTAKRNNKLESLRRIIYLGESMSSSLRHIFENELNLEVFSFFGTTEIGSMGGECRAHEGIHLYNDSVLPTVVRSEADQSAVSGDLLWTTLHFRDHPVLKYESGDVGKITAKQCPCGQTAPRLISIQRNTDAFSIYGHKFQYESFINALGRLDVQPGFFEIHLSDSDNKVEISFVLPRWLRAKSKVIDEALNSTDEIGYFSDLGYVSTGLVFQDSPSRLGRKLRRIVDRRHQ